MSKKSRREASAVMSANGRIKHLLMYYSQGNPDSYREIILELLRKMPRYTNITIFCNTEKSRTDLISFFHNKRFRNWVEVDGNQNLPEGLKTKCLLVTPFDKRESPDLGHWVRDAFFVKWNPVSQTAYLAETRRNEFFADYLERCLAMRPRVKADCDYLDLNISGGNVLLADRYILVGYEEVKKVAEANSMKVFAHQLLSMFNQSDGKPFEQVLLVGEQASKQVKEIVKVLPDYFKEYGHSDGAIESYRNYVSNLINHIDMFLTVVGTKGPSGKPLLFLAQAAAIFSLGYTEKAENKLLQAWNDYFDALETELKPYFEVRRNPVPLFIYYKSKQEENCFTALPDNFYIGCYNNCLVEVHKNTKKVWLPRISLAAHYAIHLKQLKQIEKLNTCLWEMEGFKVYYIEADVHPMLLNFSGIHCVTKELARDN